MRKSELVEVLILPKLVIESKAEYVLVALIVDNRAENQLVLPDC